MDRLAAEHRAEKEALLEASKRESPQVPLPKGNERPKLTPIEEMSESQLEAKLDSLRDALEAGMMNQSQYETMKEPFRTRLAVIRSIARDATYSADAIRETETEDNGSVSADDSSPAPSRSREFFLAKAKEEIEHLRSLRVEGILEPSEFVEQAKQIHFHYTKLANEAE